MYSSGRVLTPLAARRSPSDDFFEVEGCERGTFVVLLHN